jgi:hypothetical protein
VCVIVNKKEMPPKGRAAGAGADTAAKKQKTRAKAPKAESTALVAIDPHAPTVIYMIIDRGTGKIIYIGQTLDSSRRCKEHCRRAEADADCRLKDYLQKKQRGIDLLQFKNVPELPNGVAHMHANAFEAYLISKCGTLFDMLTNPDGCNLTAGNYAYKVDAAEIERQLADGYVWPEPAKAQVAALQAASPALKEARLQEAVLADLDARANTDPENPIEGLADALGEARLILGRMEGDGLYETVRDALLPKYEAMPPYAEVPRSNVVAELNDLSDRANEADEELGKAIRWEGKALLLDHWRDVPLTANETVHKLRVVLGVVGRFAETKLDLTSNNMQHWVAIRAWSAAHGGAKPSACATRRKLRLNEPYAYQVEEERLGRVIETWKKPFLEHQRTITGRPEEASVYVLVRDFPLLLKDIATKAEKDAHNADRDAKCIELLKRGMAPSNERKAFPDESEAEGLVPFELTQTDMTSKAFKPVRNIAFGFVAGEYMVFVEALRAAADDATKLTRTRVERLVKIHETNRPTRLAQCAAAYAKCKKLKADDKAASADAPELDASGSEGDGED